MFGFSLIEVLLLAGLFSATILIMAFAATRDARIHLRAKSNGLAGFYRRLLYLKSGYGHESSQAFLA